MEVSPLKTGFDPEQAASLWQDNREPITVTVTENVENSLK